MHRLLTAVASLVQSTCSREPKLSRCGARAWLPYGMWDLPESVIEPVSPALAGEFLSTRSPGKSRSFHGSQSERGNRPRAVKAMKHFTDGSNEILGAGTWVAGLAGLAAPLPWCAPTCLRPRASAHSFEAWKARSLVQSWSRHRREHREQGASGQGWAGSAGASRTKVDKDRLAVEDSCLPSLGLNSGNSSLATGSRNVLGKILTTRRLQRFPHIPKATVLATPSTISFQDFNCLQSDHLVPDLHPTHPQAQNDSWKEGNCRKEQRAVYGWRG